MAAREKMPAQLCPEAAVDIVGADYQWVGDIKTAIEIFNLNLLAYSDSAEANDDLADVPILPIDRRNSLGNMPKEH